MGFSLVTSVPEESGERWKFKLATNSENGVGWGIREWAGNVSVEYLRDNVLYTKEH